jgi:hypothetical protein
MLNRMTRLGICRYLSASPKRQREPPPHVCQLICAPKPVRAGKAQVALRYQCSVINALELHRYSVLSILLCSVPVQFLRNSEADPGQPGKPASRFACRVNTLSHAGWQDEGKAYLCLCSSRFIARFGFADYLFDFGRRRFALRSNKLTWLVH